MKIIIAIAFYFLHWGVCFLGTGTDKKNLIGLRSYPDEIQTRVRSDPQLGKYELTGVAVCVAAIVFYFGGLQTAC